MKTLLSFSLVAVLALTASAQVTVTIGPLTAPLGCDIQITVSNDTPQALLIGDGCPYLVRDLATNQVVYPGQCPIFVPFNVAPGGVQSLISWSQTNGLGQQVPPGAYQVEATPLFGGPTTTQIIVIDATEDASIASLGSHRAGTTRHLSFCAPGDGNLAYLAAAAFSTTPGIPGCGEIIPLAQDSLFALSLGPNPFFQGFSGTLDAGGRTTDPTVTIPSIPGLSGVSFVVAFVTVDPTLFCAIASVSPAHVITIP